MMGDEMLEKLTKAVQWGVGLLMSAIAGAVLFVGFMIKRGDDEA